MLIRIGDCFVDPEQIQAVRDLFVPGDETPTLEIILPGECCFQVEATMDEAEAALIDAGMIEDPYPEEDALALGEEERVELEELYEHGYEYLARDADGKLNAFKTDPLPNDGYYYPRNNEHAERVSGAFSFIEPSDGCWSVPFLLSE